jgi:mRNA-degrading endonuclease RelE of RelBE toxin-antitoxin system
VVVPAAVAKTLEKLDKPVRLRVIELIDSLATGNPRDKGKGLTANQAGKWR